MNPIDQVLNAAEASGAIKLWSQHFDGSYKIVVADGREYGYSDVEVWAFLAGVASQAAGVLDALEEVA